MMTGLCELQYWHGQSVSVMLRPDAARNSKEGAMALRVFMGALLAMALASVPALACKGPNVIFSDNFTDVDPGWSTDDQFAIGGGKVQIKPDAGKSYGSYYGGSIFDDADMCVDLSVSPPRDPTNLSGGLVFWLDDWENAYLFLISPAGQAAVLRYQKGKALYPVSWRKADSVKTGANAVNTIRVTTKGSAVSTYINDKPFVALKGQPPKGGGSIGLYGESENGAQNVWTFSNLKITDLPP
jgi:hypothetical protein